MHTKGKTEKSLSDQDYMTLNICDISYLTFLHSCKRESDSQAIRIRPNTWMDRWIVQCGWTNGSYNVNQVISEGT